MKDGENSQYLINFWEIVSAFQVELPLQKIGCQLEYNGLGFAGIAFLPLLFSKFKKFMRKEMLRPTPLPPHTYMCNSIVNTCCLTR